jgi:hypothetical protein
MANLNQLQGIDENQLYAARHGGEHLELQHLGGQIGLHRAIFQDLVLKNKK